jgi:hypothetical protein
MAGSTSRGYRYPSNTDAPNIAGDIQNLASDINTDVGTKVGLFLVNTLTFGVSPCTLDGVFTSSFRNYKIILTANIGSALSTTATMALRSSGTTATAANYLWGGFYLTGAGTVTSDNTTVGTTFKLPWSYGGTSSSGVYGSVGNVIIDVLNPALALQTSYYADGQVPNLSNGVLAKYSGFHSLTNAYDGFTIAISGSTISGGIAKVYGYN